MTQFFLTMMCSACKWKIEQALKDHGYKNFDINMETSKLTFTDNVIPEGVIRAVNSIGYKIEYIKNVDDLSDEDLAILEDALRNGYKL